MLFVYRTGGSKGNKSIFFLTVEALGEFLEVVIFSLYFFDVECRSEYSWISLSFIILVLLGSFFLALVLDLAEML